MFDHNRVNGPTPVSLHGTSPAVRAILEKSLDGQEISEQEGETLFAAQGADIAAISAVADQLRHRANGDQVSFVVNRNINFTNVCYMGCKFCGFAKRREDAGAEWLNVDQVVARAVEAWNRGATEVCIQGGLHPKMSGQEYRNLLLGLKAELPDMHIHAFSPFEVWYGAAKTKLSFADFIQDLKECGLGSMPGTAAEILDTDIRKQLTKNKLSAERWVEIIRAAHSVGVKTTATIMYGHIDGPKQWAQHMRILRDIQKDTGGFTELVPLSFVHEDSPLFTANPEIVRPGPTHDETEKMHAVSRIFLHGQIDNIQVSWTKLGAERAHYMLDRGVNDLGGTLMNESISRSAGAKNGQEIMAAEMVEIIRAAGRIPVRRNTVYDTLETYDDHTPDTQAPLVAREGQDPLAFLEEDTTRVAAE
ncbi:5-amino-6-(D-ribitylamino)uracil--L-tyrosine 4-hydroxyphenyl transferase CofH [Shimia sp. R9_3]|uniref:5-amino-6-(D-ribitylamino)uracil--L-tyrosine 4-hydroxyphenyl transferase CofH n=1 Tax=Shimia sp. R9_3 TaxID=2821113 RepID=UPI001ADC9D60|nr:5-amino-6-(D-ribitylamino)uracil--L-tyrosine 4-hydroxyphenyl transferase CofH [Shimia sp. R9_3]MBO9400026.1 5-amino-6-(D-ribitylamino)uracil--L-tyrosine 4-hydroxyphenyl transferase CofH [Shimia sp. R9_3]